MKTKRASRLLAGLLALTLLCLGGCGQEEAKSSSTGSSSSSQAPSFPVRIGDVDIPEAPRAVISLSPGTTELLFAMGYQSRVMGIGDYCDYPPEAMEKLRCGSPLALNRKNIGLRPADLVVTAVPLMESDLIWFQQQEVPVLVLPRADSLAGIQQNYLKLALAMEGQTDGKAAGERFWQSCQDKLDEAAALGKEASVQRESPLKAILLRQMSYGMATGDTLEGSLLEQLGFVNDAAAHKDWLYPQAEVKLLEPDVIFCDLSITPEEISKSVVYKPVAAVKNQMILPVELAVFERQSPRMFDALLAMAHFAFGST